ncbi:MAG TPA: hypothetical protein VLG66_06750 [Alphaproteobacteria bacterium]|nr:hypothetical protein [Alphaproteobacteria bacterium]
MLFALFILVGLAAGGGLIWGGWKIIEWQRQADVEERELQAAGLDRRAGRSR